MNVQHMHACDASWNINYYYDFEIFTSKRRVCIAQNYDVVSQFAFMSSGAVGAGNFIEMLGNRFTERVNCLTNFIEMLGIRYIKRGKFLTNLINMPTNMVKFFGTTMPITCNYGLVLHSSAPKTY